MNVLLKKMGLLSFLAILLAGCGGSPSTTTSVNSSPLRTTPVSSSSGGLALDTAIEQAAERMEKAFNAKTEIALISVSSPSAQFSEYVLTYLESILVNNGKLTVVDRANLDKVRAEQGFQLSGDVSDESAKAIGQMLGAGAIVTGTLVNLGDAYRLTLKAINVETARVAASYPADIANSPRVQTLLAGGGGTSGGTQTAQKGNTGGNTKAPATPVYKIGDTGPAGGLVFYDKGNNSGGWRYMEVATDNLGKTTWPSFKSVGETETAIGTGKMNTQVIAKSGEMTAMLCIAYRGGGFSDWFLPSKDELNLIYINLVRINHIVDWEDTYWTSSPKTWPGNYPGAQRFSDGSQYYPGYSNNNTNETHTVLAVRQF
jgi:hypothetical protein